MNDQNDDAQNFALMVLAGVVALVIAGVLGLAIATSMDAGAPAAKAAAGGAAAAATAGATANADGASATATATAEATADAGNKAEAAVKAGLSVPSLGAADARVYFELASDTLPADAQAELARIADAARADTGKVVLISGFHDASGDAAKNADLAKKRAFAVRHALEANGVARERLVMDKPRETTGGADPREARRVEMRLR